METSADTFLTIAQECHGIYREKASKFIALAIPAGNEIDVKMNLERIRKEHHSANHHCYAYRIGLDKNDYRINDDGEPSGSAGKPIFGQILSHDLSDILIIVVRYFGGTKLGIPGLINAYRTATKDALNNATIIEKTVMVKFHVSFEYLSMNDIMRIIKEKNCQVVKQTCDEHCFIELLVRKSDKQTLEERISNLNNSSIFL
ncbi:MAG: YigZ family protein, partial [Bacteroidota bacterium]